MRKEELTQTDERLRGGGEDDCQRQGQAMAVADQLRSQEIDDRHLPPFD